jgi:hypothetical protein
MFYRASHPAHIALGGDDGARMALANKSNKPTLI